jgi:hypothetical protein
VFCFRKPVLFKTKLCTVSRYLARHRWQAQRTTSRDQGDSTNSALHRELHGLAWARLFVLFAPRKIPVAPSNKNTITTNLRVERAELFWNTSNRIDVLEVQIPPNLATVLTSPFRSTVVNAAVKLLETPELE